jgi:DedD protein
VASLAEDVNVDELRRRARRRLVGAVVLALAAAVIVPMLLESEPRPLGEDIAVRIPPIDNGRFVNRLNDPAGSQAATAPATSADATVAAAPPAAAPKDAQVLARPKYDTRLEGRTDTATPGGSTATAAPAAAGASANSNAATPASAAENAGAATPDKHPGAADGRSTGAYAVQLAAFSDDKGANALAGKLRRAGYNAYTEPLRTSKGTLWRVRVGPYANREAASAARERLKAHGQSGIVAAAR